MLFFSYILVNLFSPSKKLSSEKLCINYTSSIIYNFKIVKIHIHKYIYIYNTYIYKYFVFAVFKLKILITFLKIVKICENYFINTFS